MPEGYLHLTCEQRCQIYALLQSGHSQAHIARQIGVDPSTISRELVRNTGARGYRFKQAHEKASQRRQEASDKPRKMTPDLVELIEEKLTQEQWSPDQISGRLAKDGVAFISHERIYQHVWKDKKDGGTLYLHLRHSGKKYNRRKGKNSGRGLIPNRVDIDQRPPIVAAKSRIGDWEADTIIGANHKGVVMSHVERTSKYIKLAKLPDKNADFVVQACARVLLPLADQIETITYDNGKEFASHAQIATSLGALSYFAKPYHSWERGLNEHTNGLFRQYFPKGSDFSILSDADVQRVEDKLNSRPRKIYPDFRENPNPLAKRRDPDSTERMIRPGFLDIESRQNLIELARDGLAAHRLARRANALVLLDDGMSCEAIAKVLLLDDDTIRTWYRLYEGDGIEGLTNFSYEGSACQLSGEQQEKLKAWVATALPRTTRQVGAWIENEFGVVYEGRSGLIALLHRLGLEYHKPNVIPRKLDEEKQRAFIEGYEKLLNSLGDDEAVLFADAVHPTHAARPVGCWAPSQEKLAIEQTSGRQRINIHGAIDLETGQTRMIEALTIDAASTIRLLQSIEALYPMLALIHVFLDNARYHHAKLVQEWLALPGRRIKLHFIPTYCPHLNPIERLWGLMHRNVTHNKCYATCAQFADATLSFLREKVPGIGRTFVIRSPTISASSTQRIFGS